MSASLSMLTAIAVVVYGAFVNDMGRTAIVRVQMKNVGVQKRALKQSQSVSDWRAY
ncbi:MAG: hypothetical protein WAW96_13965 [Alphaproteobacteria bacterium]